MTIMTVLPANGAVLSDARDNGRWLRVNWHPDDGLFVFSIWRDDVCAATFQLTRRSSPELIGTLVESLSRPTEPAWSPAQVNAGRRGVWSRARAVIGRLRRTG